MFNAISRTYDQVNRLVSFGIDQRWRRRLKKELPEGSNLFLLDVATGTADQLIQLLQSSPCFSKGLGIDIAEEMLAIGRRKLSCKGLLDTASLLQGSALDLPVASSTVDCATISFGIRNVGAPLQALQELHRVLKIGGRALILEFSLPQRGWLRTPYLFYLRHLLPRIAGWISGSREAYVYLNQTIEQFPSGKRFCALLEQSGFSQARAIPLTGGIATLYVGIK